MKVLQNNINYTRKISNIDLIRSVVCFACDGKTSLHEKRCKMLGNMYCN